MRRKRCEIQEITFHGQKKQKRSSFTRRLDFADGTTMLTQSFLLSLLLLSGASAQCSTGISFFITTPPKLEGLSGSCMRIPCNFSISQGHGLDHNSPIHGFWLIKDQENQDIVVFSNKEQDSKYPMTFIGNISENNCSTLFSDLDPKYNNTYIFRIENVNFSSYACDRLQINVTDSPPAPTVHISAAQEEKKTVLITCSAATPCPQRPPTLTWSLQPSPLNIREQNKDRTFTSKIQQTIILSDKHDGVTISCSASYPVKEGQVKISVRNLTLSVSYAPKDTTARVSPSSPVSAGTFVNLSCSSRANPPVSSFTWFWISTGRPVNVSVGALYSVNVTEGAEYYCEARNQIGTGTSKRIKPIVPGAGTFDSLLWWTIIGGVVGLVLLACLAVCLWWLRSAQRAQSRAEDELVHNEDDVHYGEIYFSQQTPETVDVCARQPETVYAQVKVPRAAGSSGAS